MTSTSSPESPDAGSSPRLLFPPATGEPTRLRLRTDGAALLACVLAGVLLNVLPHLLWWRDLGVPHWINDSDEALYTAIAAQAYRHHPTYLTDPTQVEPAASFYPAVQFVPGIAAAKALRWGPMGVLTAWRIWAGATVAAGFYLVFRGYLRTAAAAAALTLIALSDPGLLYGKPVLGMAETLARLATGRAGPLLESRASILSQWRLISPGLSLGYLLLHLWLFERARQWPMPGRVLLSGLSFGLQFYSYFYFWTGAGLALLLGVVLDRKARPLYFHTGWIGGLVGAPSVWNSQQFRKATSPDWLPRSDKFLPIGRFDELLIPKRVIATLAVVGAWSWPRRRELIYPILLSASGVILMNHQVLTGLQIENWHWVYQWGPCLSIVLLVLILGPLSDRLGARPRPAAALLLGAAAFYAAGLGLRAVESTRSIETIEYQRSYKQYRGQRLRSDVPRLVPNGVVAGPKIFCELASILEDQRPLSHYGITLSPWVSTPDWEERMALNAFLSGSDRATFQADMKALLESGKWGPWAQGRDPVLRRERLANRLAAYDRIARDPDAALDSYRVRYLGLPPGTGLAEGRGSGWTRLQDGPEWAVWERTPRGRQNAPIRPAPDP